MSYTNGLDKPSDYFNTVLYTGNGTARTISGVGFQPDWVWIKDRDNAFNHQAFDVVRGADQALLPNTTSAETDFNSFVSFDSDGFSVTGANGTNTNSAGLVAWNWLAGGTASSNTDGSITSSVSANTTSGFSIVSYTGTGANATVGHGLTGMTPKMVIVKGRDTAVNWYVYHYSTGNQTYLNLNGTGATGTPNSAYWNSTSPTSSVFSLGTGGDVNGSGQSKIAYCFADVKGYSKFGKYTGNGSADGTFVYTGFKPAFVLIKRTSSAGNNWQLYDNKRNAFNVINNVLFPNLSDAEATQSTTNIDMLSQGFKLRGNSATVNGSGDSYIYMAFAENPLVTSGGTPTTAR